MGALRKRVMPGVQAHPYVVEYAARISVWGRWFIWLVGVFLIVYRPGFWYPEYIEYLVTPVLLFAANGLVHHRLLTHRPVTWRWLLFLGAMDVALTTLGVFIGGGFRSFIFVGYYPAVAIFAVVFPSYWHTLAWSTMAAAAYVVVCLVASPGLDLGAGNEKVLVARLAVMYAIVLGINLITRFERIRWRTAVARERLLLQERIELSQTIHDTTAQTAYMIGLGIRRARNLAGESNQELKATLDATLELAIRLGGKRLGEMWPGLPALVGSAMDRGAHGNERTAAVAALVSSSALPASSVKDTLTLIALPTAAAKVQVEAVAPLISAATARHWRALGTTGSR